MVVELLRQRGLAVRAFVHRDDDRAATLRGAGAEVVVGDLTRVEDATRALDGVRRVYFGLGVSAEYLSAAVAMAVLARSLGEREVFVNLSQMTVSQMSATQMTDSAQQQQHWLAEQVLNWSGLPVVHLRPTVFLETFLLLAAESIAQDATIRLPFGTGRTSPVAASDVAQVAASILADPGRHVSHMYELTGPRSQDMKALAEEFSSALGRPIRYVDVPFETWRERLRSEPLSEHLAKHLETIAHLHADNRYDRLTHDVEAITGRSPTGVRDFVASRAHLFARPPESAIRA
jgi:uncharacterized protein YbjT (DUF2867 family)